MRKIAAICLILLFIAQLSFATTENVSRDRVVYRTQSNVSSNIPRQARMLLRLQHYYPGRREYVISFKTNDYIYETIYQPGQDKLTKKALSIGRYREIHSKREIHDNQLIKQEIYIGRVQERLLRARDTGVAELQFEDDVVTEEGVMFTYEVPAPEN